MIINVTKMDCPGLLCADGMGGNVLGESKAIKEYMANNPASFNINSGPTFLVRKFLQIEIDDQQDKVPRKVGPPIDIIKVTKDGAEWIEHKKECPEIQK